MAKKKLFKKINRLHADSNNFSPILRFYRKVLYKQIYYILHYTSYCLFLKHKSPLFFIKINFVKFISNIFEIYMLILHFLIKTKPIGTYKRSNWFYYYLITILYILQVLTFLVFLQLVYLLYPILLLHNILELIRLFPKLLLLTVLLE